MVAAEIVTRKSFGEVEIFHNDFKQVQLIFFLGTQQQILGRLWGDRDEPFDSLGEFDEGGEYPWLALSKKYLLESKLLKLHGVYEYFIVRNERIFGLKYFNRVRIL